MIKVKTNDLSTLIGDALSHAPKYAREDAPVLVAQLVRDYPHIAPDAIEEVVSLACDLVTSVSFADRIAQHKREIMHIIMIQFHGNVAC